MSESGFFAAPWDQKLTALTLLFSAITLGATGLLVWIGLTRVPPTAVRAFLVANALVPLGVFAAAALMAPRGYQVGTDGLRVRRPVLPVTIPAASIRQVERIAPDLVAGALRTLGTGGFFGYYGRFRSRGLGDFRMYATRSDGYVLVRADRLYVLTPESPDAFVDALDRARQSAAGGRAEPPAR